MNEDKCLKEKAGRTGIVAAAHFHIRIVYTEHPFSRVAHVGGTLNVHHVSRARAGDVEVALPIPGVEACLQTQQVRKEAEITDDTGPAPQLLL